LEDEGGINRVRIKRERKKERGVWKQEGIITLCRQRKEREEKRREGK
jgi:hypothetical protein